MFNPGSTYRIQFHNHFTFKDLLRLIPYLEKIGIQTIYASPIFNAVPGSMHGYDGVNFNELNPEIGTIDELKEITTMLHKKGMSWLQDIVPNHMAFHHDNAWLMDVLEKGRDSEFASFFDMDWNTKFSEQLLAPFLGSSLEEAIKKGELQIIQKNQKLWFSYFDNHYPLRKESYHTIKNLHTDLTTAIVLANKDPKVLHQIADEQYYQLVPWQTTDHTINYRRFFTVNALICLNVQQEQVFKQVHQGALELIDQCVIDGLRIDHIDGLYDPNAYLEHLRSAAGKETYLIVEKILEPGEELPSNWPIQGTTGYEFLAMVNNLFTNSKSKDRLTDFYQSLALSNDSIQEQIHAKKTMILNHHMQGELDNLYQLAYQRKLIPESSLRDLKEEDFKSIIGEFLIQCPVYKYYGTQFPLNVSESAQVKTIIDRIKNRFAPLIPAAEWLETLLLKPSKDQDQQHYQNVLYFYKRCMQFTGPLMAKGVEDTLMYSYNRLIGHNEVGDSPEAFGISIETFHQSMIERQQKWPVSLNATSTHDTKRGEDVRARLNVLTDLPDKWMTAVREWQQCNEPLKKNGAPDANDEYFIYQTLIGIYPLLEHEGDSLKDRLTDYIPKALREAKEHSHWSTPNEAYETAVIDFTLKLLDQKSDFWKSFQKFHHKISDYGILNSLSQLVLKHTAPGIPDTYQGTELWDLSLVDPDNRRAVDYTSREDLLNDLDSLEDITETQLHTLWENRKDGSIKLFLTKALLNLRRQYPEVFEKGIYIPLQTAGKYKDHVLAFARKHQKTWCIIAVPLHVAQIFGKKSLPDFDWKDTRICLPENAPLEWKHAWLPIKGTNTISVSTIFKTIPIAVLKSEQPDNARGAGILMPVSSLPSPFGIGDFGPGAKKFVDFLSGSAQKYWQLLPLNPTDAETHYSPYSSTSAMAGNALLISPELLANDGLLKTEDLEASTISQTHRTDYEQAKAIKSPLLEKAWQHFKKGSAEWFQHDFKQFCHTESSWLDDFAAFSILKEKYHHEPWYQWPKAHRLKEAQTMTDLEKDTEEELQFIKWKQFIVHKQWKELKAYCHDAGIQLFGDIPFYASYDSADVWSNPTIFCLDENRIMSGVAGVPPDYFSETGQLWGMPTFRWDVLKQKNYDWWVNRFRKNMDLFDVIRIDHFRALADYWEVPAGEPTAVNGVWKQGPGEDFFRAIEKALGKLPFIAEDLGYQMDKVYALRDAVGLPGMKVLQFAFGENLPTAVDGPHNFTTDCVVYTGTHDNNTTIGWYRFETTKEDRKRLEMYSGKKVSEKNVHEVLAVMAYASVARIAILPMQDVIGLDEKERMNTPGTDLNNWLWRLTDEQLTHALEKKLRNWVTFYNRL